MKNRQALLTIHRWLGLTLALLLVVQGGTGVAMVFRDEIEPVIHPELRVAPAPTRLSMQQLFDTVRTTHPDAAITRAEIPRPDRKGVGEGKEGAGRVDQGGRRT